MIPRVVANHICFTHPNPNQFATAIPGTKVNGYLVGVPHTLENAQVLRNLGVQAPSPIRTEYGWPGRFKPLPHQIVTAEMATLNKRLFILNDMGTMKTISSLWAADYLMTKGIVRKVLIASPLSTLERTWGDEIFKNFPHRRFIVAHGSSEKRRELMKQKWDFMVVNHHGLKVLSPELQACDEIDLIIIDEVAIFRNMKVGKKSNSLWASAKNLIKPTHWVWGLTGSPTPNAPSDAYGIVKLIKPENYPGHFTRFKNEVMQQFGPFKWVPRRGWEQIVNRVLQPSIRYALEDCVELPPTIYQDRVCDLSPEQRQHFVKLTREAVTEINGETVSAVNAGVLLGKLIQCVTGVLYGADGKILKIDFGPRLKILEEVIEECNEKIIIFVPLTGILNALCTELKKKWTVEVVDGSTSSGKRNQIFQDFMVQSNPRIILANPAAMAHGLTLTAASAIIWYAPIHSNEYYEQANARIVRPGQTKTTNIVHIYATPVERRIYDTLKEKGKMQQVVLELAKSGGKI